MTSLLKYVGIFITSIFCPTFLYALPPFELTTAQGKYTVIELPDIKGEFELTADQEFAVVSSANQFSVVSVKDGQELGTPLPSGVTQWKVLGQELVLCEADGWTHYTLPGLEKKQTTPFPPLLDGGNDENLALAHGWFSRGLVYEDEHDKVVATHRHPYTPYVDTSTFRDYDRRNIQACIPRAIYFSLNRMSIDGYDVLPILGPDAPNFRCGLTWITAFGAMKANPGRESKNKGVFVEFVGKHFENVDYFRRLHWWGSVPMVLDEHYDPAQWQMTALPGKTKMAATIAISPASNFLADLNKSYDEHDAIFEKYLAATTPEFELITGKKPKEIPLAFVLSLSGNQAGSSQLFWTEMSREQILARYTGNLREQKAKDDYRAAVFANEAMIRNHEQAVQQISLENSKLRQEPPRFKANFRTYAVYASMISVLFVVACFCGGNLIWMKRRTESVSSNLGSAEPPIVESPSPLA